MAERVTIATMIGAALVMGQIGCMAHAAVSDKSDATDAPASATAPAAAMDTSGTVKAQPYTWRNVQIVAGGFVPGIVFSPAARGLVYARTDMGGAYRWDAAKKQWIPLTDWASQKDWNLRGIESIGVDPTDANRVYIAAGTYTNNWAGNGAILRSHDQGRTWQRTDMPFKMGGNEDGRSAGERLAVDPNSNNILYFGSRHDGLWKSVDYGATWKPVDSFPVKGDARSIGIVFVLFDKSSGSQGKATPTIYVGSASPEGTGLYRSTDGGASWSPVPGQPAGQLPHQCVLDTDGSLYLTYGDKPGPNGMSAGAVWKYDTKKNAWTNVSPLPPGNFGYAGLSRDARHPGTVMVSTMDRWNPGDDLLRTTDGGKTWKALSAKSTLDPSLSPYLNWGKATPRFGWWIGALAIDPFDSGHVMYGTGATIWETDNATAADKDNKDNGTQWHVGAPGLEETAVIDLISPPAGPHLISALGDIGGFTHDDLDRSPKAGMWTNPQFSNTDSLDYAESVPSLIVRVGRAERGARCGAYSQDSGATWTPFASEPEGSQGSGAIAVSADGGTFLWAPRGGAPAYSTDRGATWTACQGLPNRVRPVADRKNPRAFYALDSSSGKLYASTDGGAHFAATAADLPTGSGELRAAPDAAGDLWLTVGGGLYHSTDAGASFAKLTTAQQVASVGFGKAAPGKSYASLYIIGTVRDVPGFFRSDDRGASWVRINDDQHQYGLVGPIIGDPRVYGRVYLGTNGRGILYADPVGQAQAAQK